MEEGGRSHFTLEVDDLNHRILNLRDTVTTLFEAVTKRRSETTSALQLVQESAQVIQEVSTAMVTAAAAAANRRRSDGRNNEDVSGGAGGHFTVASEDVLGQLAALRGQLLQLSLAEGRLAALRAHSVAALLPPHNANR